MKNVTILIKPASSLCNMRCGYCFYADTASKRTTASYGIMSDGVLNTLIRRAFECASESVSFVFQGGEPTLAGLDFFKSAVTYQREYNKNGIKVFNSLQTNGILINDDWARFLGENGFLVGLSLDGGKALHDRQRKLSTGEGSYTHVLAAVDRMRREGVRFNILTVVTKDCAKNPKGVYEALSEYGFLQFIPLIPTDECGNEFLPSPEEYGNFLIGIFNEYKRDILRGRYVSIRDFDSYVGMLLGAPPSSCALSGRCGGYFTVEADGGVYPCDFYVTDEYRIGSILESSFSELANEGTARDFIKASLSVDEKCKLCPHLSLCRGGCRKLREPFPTLFSYCCGYKLFFDSCKNDIYELARLIASRKAALR